MPPRKQASKAPQSSLKEVSTPSAKEAEDELKRLAAQAKENTFANHVVNQVGVYVRSLVLITLMAVYSNVSLLALSPVYGQIPATAWHNTVIWAALFIGWSSNLALRRALPYKTIFFVPLVAAYIPMAQFYLFKLSGTFGAKYGPAITEGLTLAPLLILTTACTADTLEVADLSLLPGFIADATPGIGAYATFRVVELESIKHLITSIGKSLPQTRIGLEAVLAATYTIMARSRLLLLGIPALLHAAFMNPHILTPQATASLNATLNAQGWSLVDRWESVTGYMSVLDSHKDGFRVMRCDHSLLGGEWTKFKKVRVGEPIYSVFTQLEAVRLVDVPDRVPDNEAKALNIGLGIGTTPSALIAHGIDTTIIEIDPIVYDFAKKYFGLPSNHTAEITDAVQWTHKNMMEQASTYDYIIHDVFTGGAEPIDLFTQEFLMSLHALLKPNGVVAINYAGDFTLPPLSIVVNTVRSVFPSCRIFRESPRPSEEEVEENGRDFDNVIMFCVKTDHEIAFRKVREADYLQSLARKAYLLPKHEVHDSALLRGNDIGILRKNETEKLAKWHTQSARGHWAVMRHVLPEHIWESW
ncbi:hypothetical protein DL769_000808 [Monosporascus sp. CRB-8-3]|nr:hypothetical protein DL769_000808 [Monosporascus sp. CRB-8-3]